MGLTNSMYNHDAWEQFRSGEDYLANPEDYLQYYDCCWLLNDGSLYDQLQAAGWYDGQCCWSRMATAAGRTATTARTAARRIDALASLMGKLACLLACFLQPLAYSSLGVASAWPPPSLVLQLSMDSSLPRPSSRRPLLLRQVLRQHREASLRVFGLEFLC